MVGIWLTVCSHWKTPGSRQLVRSTRAATVGGRTRARLPCKPPSPIGVAHFTAWVSRTSDKAIKERLLPLAEVNVTTEDLFVDWGDTETYSLKLGRGECVA